MNIKIKIMFTAINGVMVYCYPPVSVNEYICNVWICFHFGHCNLVNYSKTEWLTANQLILGAFLWIQDFVQSNSLLCDNNTHKLRMILYGFLFHEGGFMKVNPERASVHKWFYFNFVENLTEGCFWHIFHIL